MKTNAIVIGKTIVATFGVLALFIAIIGVGNYFQSLGHKTLGNIFMILFPIAVYGYVYLLNKKMNGLDLSDYGFTLRAFFKNALIGFLSATAIILIVIPVSVFLLGVSIEFTGLKNDILKPLLQLITMLFIVGVWEEFYFRGFVFNTLIRAKFGFHISALISALFFSVIHWSSFDMNVTSWLWYLGIVFIGYILVIIYTLTKSIWSVVIFHFFWNLYAFMFDPSENEIGIFSIKDYNTYSKNIDDITVVTLAFVLVGLLLLKHRTLLQLYPTKRMFAFPSK